MNRVPRVFRATALGAAVLTSPLPAQSSATDTDEASWSSRIAISLFTGQFRPSGNSEAFRLFDAALSQGTSSLTPRITGAGVQVRAWRRATVVAEIAAGQRTVQSYSLVQPATSSAIVPQQTRFELRGVQSLGVQWQAWQWRHASRRDPLVVLHAGAGVGNAQYTLHQWGDFVDASRLVRFTDDLRSTGRGTFGYLSGTADVPLTHWASVRLDARQQYGSAAMNGDFSTFNALDLSGLRLGAGLTLNVPGFSGRR